MEIDLIGAIEEARAALGQRQESARDAGLDVAEKDLVKWDELADELKGLIANKKAESEANRNLPALPAGQVRSVRAVQALTNKADELDKAVAGFSEIEASLRGSCAAVRSARAAEKEFFLGPREDGSTGVLESDFKQLFADNHINSQAYWQLLGGNSSWA